MSIFWFFLYNIFTCFINGKSLLSETSWIRTNIALIVLFECMQYAMQSEWTCIKKMNMVIRVCHLKISFHRLFCNIDAFNLYFTSYSIDCEYVCMVKAFKISIFFPRRSFDFLYIFNFVFFFIIVHIFLARGNFENVCELPSYIFKW